MADDEMPACAVPPAAGSAAKEEQAVGAVAPAAAGGAARAAEQKTRGRKRPSQEPVPTRKSARLAAKVGGSCAYTSTGCEMGG